MATPKKMPPTKEMILILDRRIRGDTSLTRTKPTASAAPKDPSQDEVKRVKEMLHDFKRQYVNSDTCELGAQWTAVQTVVTLLQDGQLRDQKMLWFYTYPSSQKYFVLSRPGNQDEFYILGGLEHTNKVSKLSLGVVRNQAMTPPTFEASPGDMDGCVVRILAHEPEIPEPLENLKCNFQKSAHIEEVLRKKTLHCDAVAYNDSEIPLFAVLRPPGYKACSDTLTSLLVDDTQWEEALQKMAAAPTPWSLLNSLPDTVAHLPAIHHAAKEKTSAVLTDDVHLVMEKLPHTTSTLKTTSWWAAEQSQRSASIPPAHLYEPVVIQGTDGEYFELFRIR